MFWKCKEIEGTFIIFGGLEKDKKVWERNPCGNTKKIKFPMKPETMLLGILPTDIKAPAHELFRYIIPAALVIFVDIWKNRICTKICAHTQKIQLYYYLVRGE